MKYVFPNIEHINEVLTAIKDSPEFVVVEKDGYTVINYVVSSDDTFPKVETVNDAIRRECRGLIFDKDGQVIARRYHKFFNVNEKDETQMHNINVSHPHIVLEKLDGSMITPIVINGKARWGTKMGVTDVALPVEVFVTKHLNYSKLALTLFEKELTPIFEWCSRKQRIVLDYPEDQLILTAIRNNFTGEYVSYQEMINIGNMYNIPVVKAFDSNIDDLHKFMQTLQQHEEIEGVVLRFDDGHMVKIKTEWYLRIHKAKDLIMHEHDVCSMILENTIDDAKSFLPEADLDKVNRYEQNLIQKIYEQTNRIYDMLENLTQREVSRKDYAVIESKNNNPWDTQVIFRCWDNRSKQLIFETVRNIILKNSNKIKNFDEMKSYFLKGIDYV